MNKLTYEIVKHIFQNFGVFDTQSHHFKSLRSKEFRLNKNITLVNENKDIENKIWGCQQLFGTQLMTVLLSDLSVENDKSYCLIVQLKDAPAYGLYLNLDSNLFDESLIACTVNNKDWITCNLHLQATFLAGMENIKEIGFSWKKPEEFAEQYELMLSFIKYYNSLFGDINEGQES